MSDAAVTGVGASPASWRPCRPEGERRERRQKAVFANQPGLESGPVEPGCTAPLRPIARAIVPPHIFRKGAYA